MVDNLSESEQESAHELERMFVRELEELAEHAPDLGDFVGFRFPAVRRDRPRCREALTKILEFGRNLHFVTECVFEDEVDLCLVRFANVLFFNTIFKGKAYFNASTFAFPVDFSRAHFRQESQFANTSFQKPAMFIGTHFEGPTFFDGAAVADKLHFAAKRGDECFAGYASFCGLALGKDSSLVFENLSLAQTSFLHTNLQSVSFKNVDWYRTKSRSKALVDEFRPELQRADSMSLVERNYRELVLNL